jgi:SAM-dependent methyltransferase
MILSCHLVRAGYQVTALEPTGSGFGHFERMRAVVLAHARRQGCEPRVLQIPAEELRAVDQFDYAFSINVMEHVLDIEATLRRVVASVRPGGAYRFTCPNYLFPYEPHFNIPTLISKRVTERVMHARIHGRQSIPDAVGLWRSLNWIHVAGLRRIARRIPDVRVSFGRRLLVTMLERVVTDSDFASRRSPFARSVIRALVRLRLHHALGWVPAVAQPVMDCSVLRLSPAGGR